MDGQCHNNIPLPLAGDKNYYDRPSAKMTSRGFNWLLICLKRKLKKFLYHSKTNKMVEMVTTKLVNTLLFLTEIMASRGGAGFPDRL